MGILRVHLTILITHGLFKYGCIKHIYCLASLITSALPPQLFIIATFNINVDEKGYSLVIHNPQATYFREI